MGFLSAIGDVASIATGVSGLFGGSSSGGSGGISAQDQSLLNAEQAQFDANFALQTHQAMIDNNNSTQTAIATSHAQTAASSTAAQREVGDAEAHIVA